MFDGKFDTERLLNEYFATKPENLAKRTKSQVSRKELYEYERKLDKPLVEMNSEEIANMIFSFKNNSRSGNKYKMSLRIFDQALSILRGFFDWYIDNYKVIKNPCNDKKIKGINALNFADESSMTFTKESMEEAIAEIRSDKIDEYADYDEAIIRMFYEGFSQSLEIVNLKETDVNREKHTVTSRGREWKLSDRLFELLEKLNKMEEIPAYHGYYLFLSYRGSYFKFPTRETFREEFEERTPEYYGAYISRVFNKDIRSKLKNNINARMIYLRGFYDYIVSRIGEEETNKMILAFRDADANMRMEKFAREYNIIDQNTTSIKRALVPFVAK